MYSIFENMNECSELEVARLFPLVSEQRRLQALRYTHTFGRYCSLKSYEILLELYNEWSGEQHDLLPDFLYNEHGAPYWTDRPYFSISHCKQGIAVAISEQPIGIDIEAIRPLNEGLVQKAMNTQEQALIQAAANPALEFIRLWTRKEAYVKMLGTGINSDMHEILRDTQPVIWTEFFSEDKGYICTICKKDIQ